MLQEIKQIKLLDLKQKINQFQIFQEYLKAYEVSLNNFLELPYLNDHQHLSIQKMYQDLKAQQIMF